MRYLVAELGLKALLELTADGVTSPKVAVDIVLRVISESASTNLAALHLVSAGPTRTIDVMDRLLAALGEIECWTVESIRTVLQRLLHRGATQSEVERSLRVAIFRQVDVLPLEEAMVILGKDRCCRRVSHALENFRCAQLIG